MNELEDTPRRDSEGRSFSDYFAEFDRLREAYLKAEREAYRAAGWPFGESDEGVEISMEHGQQTTVS